MLRLLSNGPIRRIGQQLDYLFSGEVGTRLRLLLAERKLASTLEEHEEDSQQVAAATREVAEAAFALRYWRGAYPELRSAIEGARRAGASHADLRILALNQELHLEGNLIEVRTPGIVRTLIIAMGFVVLIGFTMLCAMTVFSSAPILTKAAIVSALLMIFMCLYWGWSLYTSRALEAGHRVRIHLQTERARANVVPFPRRRLPMKKSRS